MSKNHSRNSKNPCTVISKYFSSSPVMDESLSEFKEKKTGYTGPKNSTSKTGEKERGKVKPKRIKGQKDIRTALKSKKNDLLTYAKKFDEVCRQSGVDVDSEQLQLAIALTKSVETTETKDTNNGNLPLTSQGKAGKIRTTLQEYGFTVPEIKITKKRKKCRKNYKLLLATDAEKQQIISDKYAQVILENLCKSKVGGPQDFDSSKRPFYYLATSIPYVELQNNNILYVENLIERSVSKGSLLRNWANIPGRPVTPEICEPLKMNFSEIECSQDELDIVLSGTLKSAKSIVQDKMKAILAQSPIILVEDEPIAQLEGTETFNDDKNKQSAETIEANHKLGCSKDSLTDATNNTNIQISLATSSRIRSCSPDIFDDEGSVILDGSHNCNEVVGGKNDSVVDLIEDETADTAYMFQCRSFLDKSNDSIMDLTGPENLKAQNKNTSMKMANNSQKQASIMDLTEVNDYKVCCNKEKNVIANSSKTQLSQESNFTKRNSNDFMEMTKCITVSSQLNHFPSSKSVQTTNKTRRISNDLMEMTECVAGSSQTNSDNVEHNSDLSQKSNGSITAEVASEIIDSFTPKIVDLSQSSNSEDELPFVKVISGRNNKSLDDTILLNSADVTLNHDPFSIPGHVVVEKYNQIHDENLDLTQSPTSPIETIKDDEITSTNHSFYEDYVFNHSGDDSATAEKICLSENNSATDTNQENDEVDLTQSGSSNDTAEVTTSYKYNIPTSVNSSLGKRDEVSIDYDELFDNVTKEYTSTSFKTDSLSYQPETCSEADASLKKSENDSNNSQVFDISDKELEYSLNKSRNNIAIWDMNFGGISVMENINGAENCLNTEKSFVNGPNDSNIMKKSLRDSYLPMVNIKVNNAGENNVKTVDTGGFSKEKVANAFVDTPNTKYIVKTDQVTPMLDYASMSTPQRNKELDKYGLKPFKRKRAIQLLTHLYNQTHPIVEGCPEDLPSPSKKPRHSSQPSPKTSTNSNKIFLTSPKKKLKVVKPLSKLRDKSLSPDKLQTDYQELNKENNIYEITSQLPIVKDISCSEEDWVFQKKEKAKLHSCRVPLHIALHNYISCRRKLREAILKYEPVNIDVIHKELATGGFRYDPKDLLKYLDRKCITVKTADNNARNKR